ncbi:Hypothetical protein, putative [Bodo saltans]|uniref:Histone RNA hairpin-binding protein RNA-binding domain-containing protein n=1 Tax=Bodo saltans TaxID=75058 RepID=A0A0S4J0L8_BODSA|nr:Hypothetical protein, putative [Bodo saltans]|eukprot:CUG77401.1 Hypothetical protein, putative [Bodo saltans]
MSATNQHVGLMEAELVRAFTTPNADQRNSSGRQPSPLSSMPRTQQKQVRGVSRPLCNNDDEEDVTDRKMHQRTKQIQYGLNTDGYANMVRLVKSDSRLRNGGVLPLQPPSATLKVSKRAWDVLARKWRRALHLFDDVFIEEEDKDTTTLEQVVEQQRMKWVAQRNQNLCRADRTPMSASSIFAARNSPSVVKRLPMEDNMKPILRSLEYFQDLHAVVPDHASSLTRGNTGVSPTDAGIKMFIAPSAVFFFPPPTSLRKKKLQHTVVAHLWSHR